MQNIYKNIKLLLLLTPLLGGIACKKFGATHPTANLPANKLTAMYAAFSRQYEKEGVKMSYYSPWCNLSMHAEAMPGAGAITYGYGLYAGEAYNYGYRRIMEGRWEGGTNEWLFDDALVSVFRAQQMAEEIEKLEVATSPEEVKKGKLPRNIYLQAKSLRALAYYVRYLFFGPESLANPMGGAKSTWNMELDQIIALFEDINKDHDDWQNIKTPILVEYLSNNSSYKKCDQEDTEEKVKKCKAKISDEYTADNLHFEKSVYANILGVKGMLARLYALKGLNGDANAKKTAADYATEVIDAVAELEKDGVNFGAFKILWGFDTSEGASGYNRIWKDIAGAFSDFAWLRGGDVEDIYNPMSGTIYRQTVYGDCPAGQKCAVEEIWDDPNKLVIGVIAPRKKSFDACQKNAGCKTTFKQCADASGNDPSVLAQCKADFANCNETCYQIPENQYIYESDDLTKDDIDFYPSAKSELIIVRLQEMEDIQSGDFAKDRAFRNKSIFHGMINRAVAVRKMELDLDLKGVKVTFVPTNISIN